MRPFGHGAGSPNPVLLSQYSRVKRRVPGATARPSASRTAMAPGSSPVRISGGLSRAPVSTAARIGIRPSILKRPRQRQSQSPPQVARARNAAGIAGTRSTAEGQDDTVFATATTAAIPHPMGCSASASSSIGIRRNARMAQGMIPESGDRDSEDVGDDSEHGEPVEVVNRIGSRRETGDQRRQPHTQRIECDAPRKTGIRAPAGETAADRLVERDESDHGRERHLKACAEQAFRRDQEDRCGREGDQPH